MKHFLTILLFGTIVALLPTLAQSEEYRIYPSGKPVVSRYIVKSRPDGSMAVYDSRQIVIPKYIVRPNYDGSQSVYKAGKPVLPLYQIEKRGK